VCLRSQEEAIAAWVEDGTFKHDRSIQQTKHFWRFANSALPYYGDSLILALALEFSRFAALLDHLTTLLLVRRKARSIVSWTTTESQPFLLTSSLEEDMEL
jgi:hypothetical protein